jgi:hypothetical protein
MIHYEILQTQIEEFILCLKEERFYDAHEALELLWFPLRHDGDDEVNLLRGYINASVSFELHKRGRDQSAHRVWNNFTKYQHLLSRVKEEHRLLYQLAENEILKIKSDAYM